MRLVTTIFTALILLVISLSCAPTPSGTSSGAQTAGARTPETSSNPSRTGEAEREESALDSGSEESEEAGGETEPGTEKPGGGSISRPAGETVPLSELPAGWREDVPLMAGFTVKEFEPLPSNGMFAMTEGNVSREAAYNFYRNLPGWEQDPETPSGSSEDHYALNFVKGEYTLTIGIMDVDGKTALNISVVKQDKATS